MEDEVAQAGGEHLAVGELGVAAGAVFHGLRAVEEDVRDVVGLLLELLDVIAVGAAEDLPVEVAEVVAGRVFAVLGELDGEAVVRGLVLAGHVALDEITRVHPERLGAGNRDRVEKRGESDGVHQGE